MAHLGDFDTSTIVYGKFSTYRPSTGATFTLAGTPALSVYKDNSVTQSTTGVTLTADFDSVTGLNHFAIDTSADGSFYAAGSFFHILITTGTVDSVSVTGSVVGSFTLRKDSALKPTTAGRTLDVSAGGEAGVDWANVGSPTTAVNLSATNIDVDQIVASVTGGVGSVAAGGIAAASFAAGAINAAAIAADAIGASELAADAVAEIADALWDEATVGHTTAGTFGEQVKTDIDAIVADTGTDGVIVASLAAGSITAAKFAAGAIDAAAIAADAITAAKIADGAIDAPTFAAGAINAAAIAADAIGASELAADA